MENFENIYLDLSKQAGRCRLAETGLGWKPAAGGDTFTLDGSALQGAQWSRASKGYEIKIFTRDNQVIQFDGFQEEVSTSCTTCVDQETNAMVGSRPSTESIQDLVWREHGEQGACAQRMELGQD